MIIYFNFNQSKLEFIWQQNSKKYFAVNFLSQFAAEKDFVNIIKHCLKDNFEILKQLKKDKVYIVLPDSVVGFDNMIIPADNKTNEHFKNKFSLYFKNPQSYEVCKNIISTNKLTTTISYCVYKKSMIFDIINAFSEFSIKIRGISNFSKLITNQLIKTNKELAKGNFIFGYIDEVLKYVAVSHGHIVGIQTYKLYKNNNNFVKNYVELIKNSIKKREFLKSDINFQIEKIDNQSNNYNLLDIQDNKITNILNQIVDIKDYYKKSNMNLNFNQTLFIYDKSKFINQNYDEESLKNLINESNIYNLIIDINVFDYIGEQCDCSLYKSKRGLI